MSTPSGSTSPVSVEVNEEVRKKGARGGKRSVAHLSKAQLARKRANDREAQRNIRQRTKEHIETLERKLRSLEQEKLDGPNSSSLERVMKRNEELECEVQKLRAQISIQLNAPLPTPPVPTSATDNGGLGGQNNGLMMPKSVAMDYFSAEGEGMWNGRGTAIMETIVETGNNTPYNSAADTPLYSVPASIGYAESENSQHMYSPLDEPMWDEPLLPPSQCSNKSAIQLWTSFPSQSHHSPLDLPPRYQNQDIPILPPHHHTQQHYPTSTSCWQAQPSTFAWQITTKIKAPATALDHLLLSCMQTQRTLQLSLPPYSPNNTSYPPITLLFQPPTCSSSPSKTTPLTTTLTSYSTLLTALSLSPSRRRISEKLAFFTSTYSFLSWLITPSSSTYNSLHEWQAPRPSQLLIPHPLWMDLVPWGKMRDKIIHEQERYATEEFQRDVLEGWRVGWRGECVEVDVGLMVGAGVRGEGEMRVSRDLEEWVRDAGNFHMSRGFAEKWPEFGECCRFEDA